MSRKEGIFTPPGPERASKRRGKWEGLIQKAFEADPFSRVLIEP